MPSYPADQVCSPPELPPYLRSVRDLQPIVGIPSDEDVIGIHAVMRMAYKFIDEEPHVTQFQICVTPNYSLGSLNIYSMLKWPSTEADIHVVYFLRTYTPPVLPAHVSPILEPVSGTPSKEDIIKVQGAVRLYQRFADIPTMFDPQLDADLSQHLFNLQMERYMRSGPRQAGPTGGALMGELGNPTQITGQADDHVNLTTNNAGRGADHVEPYQSPRTAEDTGARDAMERSNQLAEQANQLIERSNQLAERSNQIAERANQLIERGNEPSEPSNNLTGRFDELFEQLNKHLEKSNNHKEKSNRLVEELVKPVVKFGDVLKNINGVLVGIQHAIVRSHKGNTVEALDCLVNQKGETPGMSDITGHGATYTPPTLPAHVVVQLEPINGVPSEEHIIRVQDAIRLYQQFSNVPSIYDPRVNMELSQHLFDLQMAKYTQRAKHDQASPVPPSLPTTSSVGTVQRTADTIREVETATNNAGTGADVIGSNQPEQRVLEGRIHDAIERSNRLAEQANQLIERSNQLAERSNQIADRANQLVGQSNRPVEHSDAVAQRFNQLFERLNQHFERSGQHHERSNFLAEELIKPVDKIGGALGNINKILMRIQHAIVRNQKDNGISALDCLANEKGETPGMSDAMSH
ncbi:hypothetical protein FRC11_003377, partial [Ceratobasidium sp. 423]